MTTAAAAGITASTPHPHTPTTPAKHTHCTVLKCQHEATASQPHRFRQHCICCGCHTVSASPSLPAHHIYRDNTSNVPKQSAESLQDCVSAGYCEGTTLLQVQHLDNLHTCTQTGTAAATTWTHIHTHVHTQAAQLRKRAHRGNWALQGRRLQPNCHCKRTR